MAKKVSNEEFIEKMKNQKPTLVPLEKYIDNKTSIMFKCVVCGNTFKNAPVKILGSRNQGCHRCYSNNNMTSNLEFKNTSMKNEHVVVIGEYKGSKNKVKVKCKYCGEEFMMRADSVLSGRGHQSCLQKMINREPRMTQQEYVNKLNETNSNIVPLGIFTKTKDKMIFRCKVCEYEWEAEVGSVLYGESSCPKCNESKGEKKIAEYLTNNKINFTSQYTFNDCTYKRKLPFDFFLDDKNTCIEYQGKQHYVPIDYFGGRDNFDIQCKRDKIKVDYCKDNNITLIKIPYTDFDNIENILEKFIN